MSLDKPPAKFMGWLASWMPHGDHFTAMIGGFWYTAEIECTYLEKPGVRRILWKIECVENSLVKYV